MPKRAKPPTHAVIDGSNLATEGRKEPSLAQLRDAVEAIRDEFDYTHVTVVVDATFEHRVAKSESKAARKAIDDNEIITPPAGVIGRGDTFILEVADRAGAVVFSNDSFQEFHGQYEWLFDEGRLVGGKPVPGVGWIYVPRSPVRGPVSRRATSAKKRRSTRAASDTTQAAKAATDTTDTTETDATSTEKRGRGKGRRTSGGADAAATPAKKSTTKKRRSRGTASGEGSNDADTWATFREDYPVGTTVAVTVDRFSSHGAYGSVDDAVIYLPNRLLGDPPPSKARDVLDVGATMDFVVHRFDEERLGIDAGLTPAPDAPKPARAAATPAKKAAAKPAKKRATAAKKRSSGTTKKAAKKTASRAAKKTTSRTATKTAAKKRASTTTKKAAKKTASRTAKKSASRTTKKTTKTTAKKATRKRTSQRAASD